MINFKLVRTPYWKRVLSYPKVFYGHYKIARSRRNFVKKTRVDALKDAFWLTNLLLRK